ncbi:MAG: hypothetical protein NC928_01665 [Candidatus Omnitrophica bacterium]|nr:hypothetical protein [Candidatus Omnitrophota bacterium]
MKKDLPPGVKLISYIYLVNLILYFLSLILFYQRILILGKELGIWFTWIIRLIFIFIPLYLYFRLRRLKKDAWFLAVYFHTFFLANNALSLFEYYGYLHPLVKVTGIYTSSSYSLLQTFILFLNTLFNLLILGYLIRIKRYFYTQ